MANYGILEDNILTQPLIKATPRKKATPTAILNRKKQNELAKENLKALNQKLLSLLEKNLEEIFLTLHKTSGNEITLRMKSPIDNKAYKLVISLKKTK